jgi:Holliday junction resolvase RusA-like endonuclease
MIKFFLKHNPAKATAQCKGACRTATGIRFFEKKPMQSARETLMALLREHVPAEPLQGPLRIEITWAFPYRKSEKKSVVKAGIPFPHTSRPDLDNLEKLMLDCMTRMQFWKDDSQVYSKDTAKFWSAYPGIAVAILEDNQ